MLDLTIINNINFNLKLEIIKNQIEYVQKIDFKKYDLLGSFKQHTEIYKLGSTIYFNYAIFLFSSLKKFKTGGWGQHIKTM